MSQGLSLSDLPVSRRDVARIGLDELTLLFEQEDHIHDFLPDGVCRTDPRSGERILYNRARANRPHDRGHAGAGSTESCLVCDGRITAAVDVRALGSGFTFINKNLYPILWPNWAHVPSVEPPESLEEAPASGLHFLQWTSSIHDHDFQNMPASDRLIVFERLACLEETLLRAATARLPDNRVLFGDEEATGGYVCIIKNHGRMVGGSLVHGHQQIALSSQRPRRFDENLRFQRQRGERFADFLLGQTPRALIVRDYGPAALLVPPFMRRPLDMMLVMRNTRRRYLFQLDGEELLAMAEGWHDAIRAMLRLLPRMGREPAYNIVVHNGPGAGLYVEVLPFSQETGGYEHLGLSLCQGDPTEAAARLREVLSEAETDDSRSGPGTIA